MVKEREPPTEVHKTCPYCHHNGCLSVWADGNFKCHSCGATPKSEGGKLAESDEVIESKANTSLVGLEKEYKSFRKITKKVAEKYRISTYSKGDEEVYQEYVYPTTTKYRKLPKDFRADGLNKGFKPSSNWFGQDLFPAGSSSTLTIVEGEVDAPSAYQILGGTHAVVASSGEINPELIKNTHTWLDSFEKIVIASEDDDTANKGAKRLSEALPNKVYRVTLSEYKDANEYLQAGAGAAFKNSWQNKKKYVPDFDTSTPDDYLKILDEEEDSYIPTGIDSFDSKHLGIFQSHLTLFQAPEGTGKTELFHYFEHHLLTNYPDVPFATCHLEETKKRTLLGWVSYGLEKNVTRGDLIQDMDEVKDKVVELTEGEQAHLFTIDVDEDPSVILDRVKMYASFGCKYVFIEPIQDLAQQYTGPDSSERFLSKIAVGLSRIAAERRIGIVLIAHENDEGKVSDCRKLSKQASVVVRLERDLDSADSVLRNTTQLVTKKNRPTSYTGKTGQLLFDPDTFVLREVGE